MNKIRKFVSFLTLLAFVLLPGLAFAQVYAPPYGYTNLRLYNPVTDETTYTAVPLTSYLGNEMFGLPMVVGTVTGVSGSMITVRNNSGTFYFVSANSATVLRSTVSGQLVGQVSDIQTGDVIAVWGMVTSGTNVSATYIVEESSTLGLLQNGIYFTPLVTLPTEIASGTIEGTVWSVNGAVVTLQGNNGVTYYVDSSFSQIIDSSNTNLLISDLKTGDVVKVTGTLTLGNNLMAKRIIDSRSDDISSFLFGNEFFGPFQPFDPYDLGTQVVEGTITSFDRGSVIVRGIDGISYYVTSTNNTTILNSQGAVLSASQLQVGDTVFVYGSVIGIFIMPSGILDVSR